MTLTRSICTLETVVRGYLNLNCATVFYKVRNELTGLSEATARVKMDKIPFRGVTTGTYKKPINVAKSQAPSTTLTEGWSIGVNVAVNPSISLGGSISYEWFKSLSNTSTLAMDVSTQDKWPPFHEYHLEVRIWHAKIKGECDNFLRADCGGDLHTSGI